MDKLLVKLVKICSRKDRHYTNENNLNHLGEKFHSENKFYVIDTNNKTLCSTVIAEMLAKPQNVILINVNRRSLAILDILGASNILTITKDLHEAYKIINEKFENFEIDYNCYILFID